MRRLDIVYWQTGNPGPDYNGKEREGDNLYSDSVLALDRKTGKLKWYYQFTPHDTHDWDATEPLLLVDAHVAWPASQIAAHWRIAMAFSICSTERKGNCCWPNRL